MRQAFRWLLVPVSAVVMWGGVRVLGLEAVHLLDAICPPKLVESGACIAPWHEPSLEALIVIGAGLAAFGIVTVGALIAPSHKLRVAAALFACGAVFAMYIVRAAGLYSPFFTAAGGGSVALWFVNARSDRSA
ncbi:MAG TPA: hypothetical protein VH436_24540 [Vicinamibacterales bacterium]|jgi:hypothetical protein